jgi:hypothetical protein
LEHRGKQVNFGHYEALRAVARRDTSLFPGDFQALVMKLAEIVPTIASRSYGRRPCLTLKRDIGQIPIEGRCGDRLCIFAGQRTPYVLRPHPKKENCYFFIGECFIYSRMRTGFLEGDKIEDISLV